MAEIDWTTYTSRLTINGSDEKEIIINELKNNITNNIINSPSCLTVKINDTLSNLIILSSDRGKENERKIKSLPDENYNLGDLVEYDGFNWLVTEYSRDNINQAIGRMAQCNYTLKFQNASGQIISLPVIFETKTNTVDEGKMLDVVDGVGSIKVQFYKEYSDILTTNTRLMVDSRLPNVSIPNCYRIVSSVLNSYDNANGLLTLTLERDSYNSEKDDKSLGICDKIIVVQSTGSASITYDKTCVLKQGATAYKVFTAHFYNSQNVELDLVPIWSIASSITGAESLFTTIVDSATKTIKIKVLDTDINLIGSTLTLNLTESTGTYSASLVIEVISL